MYCKNCGKQIDSDSNFCRNCGAKQLVSSDHPTNSPEQGKHIPQNLNLMSGIIKYDYTTKRDYTPTYVGIVLLFFNSIMIAAMSRDDSAISIALLCIAVFSAVWIVNIAQKLNRNQTGWGIFGFILPFLALIIIGFQRKRLYNNDYYNSTNEEKSAYNNNLAYRISKQGNDDDALILVNRSIKQDPGNHAAYDTRAYIKYYFKDYEGALEDSNKSIEVDSKAGLKFDHRGHIYKKLGMDDEAIKDWETAVEKGFEDSNISLQKYKTS